MKTKKAIKVGKYTIECKAHGYQLLTVGTQKVLDKETKNPTGETKEVTQDAGYFSELDHVTDRLIHAEMNQGDFKSIQDLID